jgi:DNA-binding NarL/FixJ family response regulator
MAVLGASANRGQVYAALRMGAKGYVSLDARPDELAKALTMVASNKTYLSSDAAELVTSDISEAVGDSSTRNLLKVALSKREIEIVQLLCDGLSNKEIGGRLHISHKTVENHRHNIYCACGVDGLPGLMRYAIQAGIITL